MEHFTPKPRTVQGFSPESVVNQTSRTSPSEAKKGVYTSPEKDRRQDALNRTVDTIDISPVGPGEWSNARSSEILDTSHVDEGVIQEARSPGDTITSEEFDADFAEVKKAEVADSSEESVSGNMDYPAKIRRIAAEIRTFARKHPEIDLLDEGDMEDNVAQVIAARLKKAKIPFTVNELFIALDYFRASQPDTSEQSSVETAPGRPVVEEYSEQKKITNDTRRLQEMLTSAIETDRVTPALLDTLEERLDDLRMYHKDHIPDSSQDARNTFFADIENALAEARELERTQARERADFDAEVHAGFFNNEPSSRIARGSESYGTPVQGVAPSGERRTYRKARSRASREDQAEPLRTWETVSAPVPELSRKDAETLRNEFGLADVGQFALKYTSLFTYPDNASEVLTSRAQDFLTTHTFDQVIDEVRTLAAPSTGFFERVRNVFSGDARKRRELLAVLQEIDELTLMDERTIEPTRPLARDNRSSYSQRKASPKRSAKSNPVVRGVTRQ